jgi:hypothetical protein
VYSQFLWSWSYSIPCVLPVLMELKLFPVDFQFLLKYVRFVKARVLSYKNSFINILNRYDLVATNTSYY